MNSLRAPFLLITRFVFILWTLVTPLGSSAQVEPAPHAHYDELFQNRKTLRQPYQILKTELDEATDFKERRYLKESRQEFRGDNSLSPIPRILTREEGSQIQRGVDQRARALVAFLRDLHSGKRSFLADQVIPENVIKKIISRSGEVGYLGSIDPSSIAFMYGPDIIRDSGGQWRVIEDNPGFIGGVGDLELAYQLSLKKYPQLQGPGSFISPGDFYQKLADALKAQASARKGKAVMFMSPPYIDNEDKRIRKIFEKHGIETVTPHTRTQLVINARGVFTVDSHNPQRRSERVGYLFLNGEHSWLDRTHPTARLQFFTELGEDYLKEKRSKKIVREGLSRLLSERELLQDPERQKELERFVRKAYSFHPAPLPGLIESILDGRVGSNYTPGIDFIGDKEFYVYVESLIRYYLKEEPILKNIPTEKLADSTSGKPRSEIVRAIQENHKQFVLKKVDGRGGEAVWVGAKLTASEMREALQKALANPEDYIVQKYTPLSVLSGQIVDLRSITAVLPNQVIVSPVPWGRGLPLNGNGKVNLSDQGREVTILVETWARGRDCRKIHLN